MFPFEQSHARVVRVQRRTLGGVGGGGGGGGENVVMSTFTLCNKLSYFYSMHLVHEKFIYVCITTLS